MVFAAFLREACKRFTDELEPDDLLDLRDAEDLLELRRAAVDFAPADFPALLLREDDAFLVDAFLPFCIKISLIITQNI